ncbi:hypothetical protein FGO68_gene10353 [Halteria grandinella]|uniref:Uncharacterized protein n=1 Tax=Halteria grandinella TaxID=5974 RepID=A0A8J8SXH7_HALGN|nr:hypothetical protein FGO68_gene10353 [Halteria grandinella]
MRHLVLKGSGHGSSCGGRGQLGFLSGRRQSNLLWSGCGCTETPSSATIEGFTSSPSLDQAACFPLV